jgi:hypothetical protein
MTKDCVVLDNVARPIWSSVPDAPGQLESSRLEVDDWFEAFVTSEDSTHF